MLIESKATSMTNKTVARLLYSPTGFNTNVQRKLFFFEEVEIVIFFYEP
jgi:hypothetical protein